MEPPKTAGQSEEEVHEARIQAWLAQPEHALDQHDDWTVAYQSLLKLVKDYEEHLRQHKQIDNKGQAQGKGGLIMRLLRDLTTVPETLTEYGAMTAPEMHRRHIAQFMVRMEEEGLGSLKTRRYRFSVLSSIAEGLDRLLIAMHVPAKRRPTAVTGAGFFEAVKHTLDQHHLESTYIEQGRPKQNK
jgi:hypothetical protein